MTDIAALREAALKATQGEWWQDVVETEGYYGDPDSGGEGFHSYAVYGPDNSSLLDMTNSTAAVIQTEDDGAYHMAWDEVGRRNAEYIALANPATILALLDQLEAATVLAHSIEEARCNNFSKSGTQFWSDPRIITLTTQLIECFELDLEMSMNQGEHPYE